MIYPYRRARRPRRAVRNDVHTVYTARRVVAPYGKRLSSSTPTSYLLPPIFFIIAVKEDCFQTSFTRPYVLNMSRASFARPGHRCPRHRGATPLPCKGEGVIQKSFYGTFLVSKGDRVPLRGSYIPT